MMYSNKLVTSLKANGKILREFKDTVYIPFGSEYSFLIKNLHSTRAVVNIFIDGEDVVPGGLVVDAGREVDLERFVKNGNLREGNKFKFIERTESIENGPRGVKLEDGLVRVEFQYEQPRPVLNIPDQYWNKQVYNNNLARGFGNSGTSGSTGDWCAPAGATYSTSEYKGTTDKFTLTASGSVSQMNVGGVMRGIDYSKNGEATAQAASAAINQVAPNTTEYHDGCATMDWNDVGITVPGSKSEQKFQHVTMGTMEPTKHTMVIKLLGETPGNKPVLKPVTVKHKPKCVTCGKQNKANAKFCTECGTALEIFA
jgi:hypothetical protein